MQMWQQLTRALFVMHRDCMCDWIPTHWSPRAQAWALVGSENCSRGHEAVLLKATRNFAEGADEGPREVVDDSLLQCESDWQKQDNESEAVAWREIDQELRDWCLWHGHLLCGVCNGSVEFDPSKFKPRQPGVRATAQQERAEAQFLHANGHAHGQPPPQPDRKSTRLNSSHT